MIACGICDAPAVGEIAPGKPVCKTCLKLPPDERRIAGLRRMMTDELGVDPCWHYLSFADEHGFLGACWVRARGPVSACRVAGERGCNPGGSVQILPLPECGVPPPGSDHVLHTDKDVIDRLCREWMRATQ